jgi:glycosyltransferase involved in cell wall biosynthesis
VGLDIAIIVSTFERPAHLERCLAALDVQRGVEGRFEVVVCDDGSRDDTPRLVAALARRVQFPLRFTTHHHDGFQLARCRNEGVAASTAPYLLFTDGDCLLPPDHVRVHLQARRPGVVIGSDCARLDAVTTDRVDVATIRGGCVERLVPAVERLRLAGKAVRAKAYEVVAARMRPRLSGNNIAVWRHDFERINGFDERFIGWGYEDCDLQDRLERSGVRVRSILWRTWPVHLWHPPAPSFTRNGAGTDNRRYFETGERPVRCAAGLVGADATPRIHTLPAPGGAAGARGRSAA